MVNYAIDPAALRPLVPAGTELDEFNGRTYVSMVGFCYTDTRVWGAAIPWHRSFVEVNLRFYVRRLAEDGWRRGVVFVKEIVPRRAVALVAKALYDENFVALPMRHTIAPRPGESDVPHRVEYGWRFKGRAQRLAVETTGAPSLVAAGSEEQFITEHYWGYTARRDGTTSEYLVDHPTWRVWQVSRSELECDVAAFYGPQFVEPLSAEPTSAFLAEGSPVRVYPGRRLANRDRSEPQLAPTATLGC